MNEKLSASQAGKETHQETRAVAAPHRMGIANSALRTMVDSMPGYVGLLRTDGTIEFANRSALNAIGATLEDIVGKKIWESELITDNNISVRQTRDAVKRASAGEDNRDAVLKAGFDRHLLKPVDFEKLTEALAAESRQ